MLTKKLRQQIVREYADKHGRFDTDGFIQEVRPERRAHPAYEWFGGFKDKEAAAEHYRHLARKFVSDLRIVFEVKTVSSRGKVTIQNVTAPLALSPLANRNSGGGYDYAPFDPENQDHNQELKLQAGNALKLWIERYGYAVTLVNGNIKTLQTLADKLHGN